MILTKLRKEGCHELEYKLGCQVRAYLKNQKKERGGKGIKKRRREGRREGGRESVGGKMKGGKRSKERGMISPISNF